MGASEPSQQQEEAVDRNLEGRVCVITGASSGIGEATARALGAAGARVALLARREERIRALAAELNAATPDGQALAIACPADVTDMGALRRAADEIRDRLGRVDCLINNAGVMLNSPFQAGLVDEWRRMVDTNLFGVLQTTHVFLADLRNGGGDIVNTSSVAGRKTRAVSSVYSATKHAVTAWSEGLRQELIPDDVRVICVEPGVVDTELPEHITHPATRQATDDMYHRSMEPLASEDIASLIAYAVSRPERVSINEVLIRPSDQEF
ncbi:MAG: SDR family oxidoreductase [Chloroflexi bacterium]|nr:SDR family oxidoreductase [Chloroflexota bacterium]